MTSHDNRYTGITLVIGLITLYVIAALINLGHFNLQGEEPRRALISIEMQETGSYIVPHALGWEYYNKPPLFNWILSGLMSATGSQSEFVSRLPSLFFLLVWGLCHFLVSRRWFNTKLALLSTFFMLTSADIFFYGLANGAEIDIFYSLLVYLQVISLFWFYEKRQWWSLFLVSYLFCALGFLTKGLPSIMFQVLTLLALCVYARSARVIFKPQHLAGILVFVLTAGAYFYAYKQQGGDPSIMLVNIINESLKKSAVGEESAGRMYKILSYPVLLFKLFAPWCLLLLVLFRRQRFRWLDNPLVKFSVLFIVFNIGVYWITGIAKLRYVYMFVPFAMNVLVHLYAQFEMTHPGVVNKVLKYVGLLFCLVAGGILLLPFFFPVNGWLVAGLVISFGCLLYVYFKAGDHRIWLFVTGMLLVRLSYAAVGIPLQAKGMADYRPMMAAIADRSQAQDLHFYLPADTLKLDVEVGGAMLYRWKKDPVAVPPFLIHQIPYYYHLYTGRVMQYDSTTKPGRLYISYQKLLENKEIERVYQGYDRRINDSLVLFRPVR